MTALFKGYGAGIWGGQEEIHPPDESLYLPGSEPPGSGHPAGCVPETGSLHTWCPLPEVCPSTFP